VCKETNQLRTIRSFLIKSAFVQRFGGVSVENFFTMGINSTAQSFTTSAPPLVRENSHAF
jgi:hypothetical protein